MKLIRKQARKIALLFSLSLLFVSCSQYDNDVNDSTKSSLALKNGVKYSGEEIFRGLFFFQNNISESIPQLAKVKTETFNTPQKLEVEKALAELSQISINFINKKYPNHFNELQEKMYSGNLFEINEIINLSSKFIEQAALSSEKYQSAFLFGKELQTNKSLQGKISKLDLNTKNGQQEIKRLIAENTETNESNLVLVWAAVAAVYAIVAVVSIAIGAYSVYFKVAYWGKSGGQSKNIFVSEDEDILIEHDLLINEVGQFFAIK